MAIAEVEARLKRELMIKKLEACNAATIASAAAIIVATLAQRVTIEEENNITGEVPLKVINITFRFAGLL